MESFITQKNKMLLWNTITQVPLFDKITKEQKISWFETQINNIYTHNKSSHINNTDLRTFNKEALSIMINILKQIPQYQSPPTVSSYEQSADTSKNSLFTQIEDTAMVNLNELVEIQKQKRSLDVQSKELNIIHLDEKNDEKEDKKKVSWKDQQQSPNTNDILLDKINNLENIIEDMRKEMFLIKTGIYKEVNKSISELVNSVIEEN